jgi:hypothetical protein
MSENFSALSSRGGGGAAGARLTGDLMLLLIISLTPKVMGSMLAA